MTHHFPSQALLSFSVEVQNLLRDFNPATVNYTIQVRGTLGIPVHRGASHRIQGQTDSIPSVRAVLLVWDTWV